MALLLSEKDVARALTFRDAYEAIKEAFSMEDRGLAVNTQRVRTLFRGTAMTYQAAALGDYFGFKTFISRAFMGALFRSDGELLLLTASDYLTRVRTGALAVLASDYLKGQYSEVCVVGLGRQGSFAVKAFNELKGVKPLVSAKTEQGVKVGLENLGAIKAEGRVVKVQECVSSADVVTTVTNSKEPFVKLESLRPGSHVNAMGSNLPERAELFPEVLKNASLIAVEDVQQAMSEAGELILARKLGMLDEGKVVPFSSVVSGKNGRRSDGDLTVFKSVGIGLIDVAVMVRLLELANKYGLGKEVSLSLKWSPR